MAEDRRLAEERRLEEERAAAELAAQRSSAKSGGMQAKALYDYVAGNLSSMVLFKINKLEHSTFFFSYNTVILYVHSLN